MLQFCDGVSGGPQKDGMSNKNTEQLFSKTYHIVKSMSIDNKLGIIEMLNNRLFSCCRDLFLHLCVSSRCSTISGMTVMLGIEVELNVL